MSPKKNRVVQLVTTVNIEASVDSALIMADNYATAMSGTPEIAPSRLNMFKSFCKSKPQVVQDSICNRIFDFFTQYIESDKAERATAFKNCYEAISSTEDAHRGPLYAMELQDAIANSDTIKINQYLPLLEEYASRMGFDYDDEISQANHFLTSYRSRRPLNESFPGIWISEDIVGLDDKGDLIKGDEYHYYNTVMMLQIRNRKSTTYNPIRLNMPDWEVMHNYKRNDSTTSIDVFKGHEYYGLGKYKTINKWEIGAFAPYYNKMSDDSILKAEFNGFTYDPYDLKDHMASFVVEDFNSNSIYVFWGDERLKRGDADISAAFRQLSQNTHASVLGELSRSKYSFSDRLAGSLTSGLVYGVVDAIISSLMVSTDKIWSVEATLQMINPYHMVANISINTIISSSDSSKPKVYTFNKNVNYYRWESSDDIFFKSIHDPLYWSGVANMYHHTLGKEQENKYIEIFNKYSQEYNQRKKEEINKIKKSLKTTVKNSTEYNEYKLQLKRLKDNGDPEYSFNKMMLQKLKRKAENYQP